MKMSEDEYEKLVYDTLFLYYYVIENLMRIRQTNMPLVGWDIFLQMMDI